MQALVLTFDNLGEASELERGTWPAAEPLGRHPSVERVLPRLLDELDAHRLSATFFVEAINCELYPDALRAIDARGHELGVHGWRHEPWASLTPARERHLLERSGAAFAGLGFATGAFRPPGGQLTARTEGWLRELGYAWCSAAGSAVGAGGGLARVPFDWELVDAYHLMESFSGLRARRGDGSGEMGPEAVAERLGRALSEGEPASPLTAGGAVQTLILHPFLMLDEAWFQGVRRLLAQLAGLVGEGRTWVVPGGRLVASLGGAAPE
jgi:peptidoglycan/xylan/chitin deacetylase (PgdA/CDA1 family)